MIDPTSGESAISRYKLFISMFVVLFRIEIRFL